MALLTTKQTRVVEALADPRLKTDTEIAKHIGVDRNTVSLVRRNPTAAKLVQAKIDARADKARDILRSSARRVAKRLATDDSDEGSEYALRAWGTSAVVLEKVGEGEPDDAPNPDAWAAKVRAIVHAALRCGMDRPHVAARILGRHLHTPDR